MAAGDVVALIHGPIPPSANAAAWSLRSGGSTPAEGLPVFLFDDTAIEYMDFLCTLIGYSGSGGVDIEVPWSAADTTVDPDVVKWEAGIRAIPDDAEDIDGSHSYTFTAASEQSEASASGEQKTVTISITHANMDGVANGDPFILRMRRNTTTSGNNLGGDAQLWFGNLRILQA